MFETCTERHLRVLQEEFKDLTKWWKEQLGSDVIGVKVSKRLANTPVVVVTSKHGWSANMERIMKAQVLNCGNCSWTVYGTHT